MKKPNHTERQRNELARRKAMGVAVIQKPLRYIAAKTNTYETDAKGLRIYVESAIYQQARHTAEAGNGAHVNRLARQVA